MYQTAANVSMQTTVDNDSDVEPAPEALFTSLQVFIIIVMVVGIPGNLLTIMSVYRYKRLRTAGNFFIMNLSISDGLYYSFSLPLRFATFHLQEEFFPDQFCVFLGAFSHFLIGISMLSLSAIALNRLLFIKQSKYYKKMYSPKSLTIQMIAMWCTSLFLTIVLPCSGLWGDFSFQKSVLSCTFTPHTDPGYQITIVTIGFWIPTIFIITCYSVIYRVFMQNQKKVSNWSNADYKAGSSVSTTNSNIIGHRPKLGKIKEECENSSTSIRDQPGLPRNNVGSSNSKYSPGGSTWQKHSTKMNKVNNSSFCGDSNKNEVFGETKGSPPQEQGSGSQHRFFRSQSTESTQVLLKNNDSDEINDSYINNMSYDRDEHVQCKQNSSQRALEDSQENNMADQWCRPRTQSIASRSKVNIEVSSPGVWTKDTATQFDFAAHDKKTDSVETVAELSVINEAESSTSCFHNNAQPVFPPSVNKTSDFKSCEFDKCGPKNIEGNTVNVGDPGCGALVRDFDDNCVSNERGEMENQLKINIPGIITAPSETSKAANCVTDCHKNNEGETKSEPTTTQTVHNTHPTNPTEHNRHPVLKGGIRTLTHSAGCSGDEVTPTKHTLPKEHLNNKISQISEAGSNSDDYKNRPEGTNMKNSNSGANDVKDSGRDKKLLSATQLLHYRTKALAHHKQQALRDGVYNRRRKEAVRLTLMMVCIYCLFVVCILPYFLVNIVYRDLTNPTAYLVGLMFTWFNGCINPVIYAMMNAQFRFAFRSLLTGCASWCCCDDMKEDNSYATKRDPNSQQKKIKWQLDQSATHM